MIPGSPHRILLVYDHATHRAVHTAVLRGAGFAVLEAGSGAEALELLRQDHPDVVLVRSILPDMQAADVCRRLRADARTSDIPIIQISAESDDEAVLAGALEAGADTLLTEPANAQALIDTTRAVLRMRAATDRLRRLQRLGVSLAQADTVNAVLRVMETEMIGALGASGGVVALLNEDRSAFAVVMGVGYTDDVLDRFRMRGEGTPVADAIRTERPIFFETRRDRDERYPHLGAVHALAGDGALVATPLTARGVVAGAICFCFATERQFSSDERAFIVTASRMCSEALERSRLCEAAREAHNQAQETAEQLASLQTVTAALSEAGSVDEVLDAIVTRVVQAVGADAGMVALLGGAPAALRCVRMQGFAAEYEEQCRELPVDGLTPLAQAVRTGECVMLGSLAEAAPYADLTRLQPPSGDAAFAAIPLRGSGEAMGAIGLRFPARRGFRQRDVASLHTMARHCAQGLQRARLLDAEKVRSAALELRLAETQMASAIVEPAQPVGIWEFEAGSGEGRRDSGHFRWLGLESAPARQSYAEWLSSIHPEDREEAARHLANALDSGGDFCADYRIVRDSGEVRCIKNRGRSIAGLGKTGGLIGATTDVTHMVHLQQELCAWKDRHQALCQAGDPIVYDWNPRTGAIQWEGSVRATLGYEPEELGELNELATLVHPEDRAPFEQEVARVLRDHVPFRLDYRVRRKDGSYAWFRDAGQFVADSAGRATRVVGFMLDITAEREAQIRLSIAQRAARAGVWDQDLVTGEIRWTDEYRRLFDIDPSLPASRELWLRLIVPEDRDPTEARFRMILEQKREDIEVQYRVLLGARIRWFAVVGRVFYENGTPVRMTGITIDITDRKLAEEAVRETGQLETLGQLAGGIAHQFNNLLTGVLGNASMLLYTSSLSQDDREMVQGIVNSSQQAAHLVRQLLAYSGQGRFHLERLDMAQLVERLGDLMLPSLPKHVRLHMDLVRDLPVVEADSIQMQQIILNLVLNAGEAIPEDREGIIRVQTGVEALDAEAAAREFPAQKMAPGSYVYVEVGDNGSGMNPETLQRIFDPFFTTKFLGRGLGLAAVAGIVRGHRGAIRVRSQAGSGSQFRVYLPCVAPQPPHRMERESTPADRAVILVVDDEEVVRNLAASALVRLGYEVTVVAGGAEAITMMEADPRIDLVVLDLAMPGMSGLETYYELRRRRPGVRILISSGYNQSEAARQLHGEPTAGYLQKPYTVQALSGAVRGALES